MNKAVRSIANGCLILIVLTGLSFGFVTSLLAETPPVPPPTTIPQSTSQPSQVPSPAQPTKTAAVAPTLPPDTFDRFGRIVTLNDEVAHPLKLSLPFPGVGEVKVPNQDELTMREKLEQLAMLSDCDIHKQLEQWPPYGKMTLKDQGSMLQRIQDFRDRRTRMAKEKREQLGLSTLTPEQQTRFEKEYWDKRLQMDRDLAKQFQPIVKDHEQKMLEDLFREFSSQVHPGAQVEEAPKPSSASPTPASAVVKSSLSSVPLSAKATPSPSVPMTAGSSGH